jgi:hypothetical protein
MSLPRCAASDMGGVARFRLPGFGVGRLLHCNNVAPDDYCMYNYNIGDDTTPAYRRLMSPAWHRTASVFR